MAWREKKSWGLFAGCYILESGKSLVSVFALSGFFSKCSIPGAIEKNELVKVKAVFKKLQHSKDIYFKTLATESLAQNFIFLTDAQR